MQECVYCKSGNFHVKIIHVLNIHIDLFLWVYGTHENILTWTYFNTILITIVLLILCMSISLYYLAIPLIYINLLCNIL